MSDSDNSGDCFSHFGDNYCVCFSVLFRYFCDNYCDNFSYFVDITVIVFRYFCDNCFIICVDQETIRQQFAGREEGHSVHPHRTSDDDDFKKKSIYDMI